MAGVHHHAGRLVHHQHVIVFVNDVQGNVFRQNLRAAPLVGHDEFHHVARSDNVIGLDRFVVHQHIAQFDGLLHTVTGCVLLVGGDEFVYPQRLLAFVHQDAEMFEHFIVPDRLGHILPYRHSERSYLAGTFRGSSVR